MDPLRHLGDGRGVRGPTERCVPQGGDPAGLELGAGGVEVALASRQTLGRSYLDDTAETEVRVVEDPPDQIRAIESRGGTGGMPIQEDRGECRCFPTTTSSSVCLVSLCFRFGS